MYYLFNNEIYITFSVNFNDDVHFVNSLDELDFSIEDCRDYPRFYVKLDEAKDRSDLEKLMNDYLKDRGYENVTPQILLNNLAYSKDDKIQEVTYSVKLGLIEKSLDDKLYA